MRSQKVGSQRFDVIVNSTVQMEGAIEVPLDPYLGWAELNGIPDAPFEEDHDGDGVPNGMLCGEGCKTY